VAVPFFLALLHHVKNQHFCGYIKSSVLYVAINFTHTYYKETKMFTTPKPTPARCLHQIFILSAILLLAGSASAYSGGTGEPNNPYQIATAADLLGLGADVDNYDKFFILTADINLASYDFNSAVIAPGNYYPAFTGSFDGACHKISNLTINVSEPTDYDTFGLFGKTYYVYNEDWSSGELVIHQSEIKNLNLEDVNITITVGSGEIGGLIGNNYGVPITNCHSTVTITGEYPVMYWSFGGLVGANSYGTISNCSSEGNIWETFTNPSAHAIIYLSGLVGVNMDAIIIDSHSDCNITSTYVGDYTGGGIRLGGLVAYNTSAYNNIFINNCYSTGTITKYNHSGIDGGVGGLVGRNYCPISKCFSTSPIIINGDIVHTGGLVGCNESKINDSYSTGPITVLSFCFCSYLGGLVGSNAGEINDCYSTGPVTRLGPIGYYDHVGGLVGYNGGILATIRHCYSVGEVDAMNAGYVGGLVGNRYDESSIISSYFLNTSGPANGLGEPLTDAQMKQQASFAGWDFVSETVNGTEDIWWILENITYPKLNWQRIPRHSPCGPAGPGGVYFPDYDFDTFVHFVDFAIFADAWLTENSFISLDGDNDVDIYDLEIFCDFWLKGL